MRLQLNGPFRIYDDQDRDVTPKGIKERGLLALLLLSPGQRRTRAWVQDKLWSDRSPEQAAASFRQALSNMRKALGTMGAQVQSDRSAVWFAPLVSLQTAFDLTLGDLLDDIDIPDPEFTDWLRALRMRQDAPAPAPTFAQPPRTSTGQRPLVVIRHIDRSGTARGQFILGALSQKVAAGLAVIGGIDVTEWGAGDQGAGDDHPTAIVELECLDDTDTAFVLLRVLALPNRRIAWSGRVLIEPRLAVIWASQDVKRVITKAIRAVGDTVITAVGLSPMAAIQKAIRRRSECDRASLRVAEDLLRTAQDSDMKGLALAWRGSFRLDERVEYCENDADRLAEGLDFNENAVRFAPDCAAVWAMASEVTLFASHDSDKAAFYAKRAVKIDDQNPDALSAVARVLSFEGRNDQAHDLAIAAQHCAQGSLYCYEWDLMAAVAKIQIGDMAGAYDMALSGHQKMPFSRQTLRYLTILSCLDDRLDDATRNESRLRRLEPDFSVRVILENYPALSSTRDAELRERLRMKLA